MLYIINHVHKYNYLVIKATIFIIRLHFIFYF